MTRRRSLWSREKDATVGRSRFTGSRMLTSTRLHLGNQTLCRQATPKQLPARMRRAMRPIPEKQQPKPPTERRSLWTQASTRKAYSLQESTRNTTEGIQRRGRSMPSRRIVSRESMQSRPPRGQLTTNRLPGNLRAPQPCIKPQARGRRTARRMLQSTKPPGSGRSGKTDMKNSGAPLRKLRTLQRPISRHQLKRARPSLHLMLRFVLLRLATPTHIRLRRSSLVVGGTGSNVSAAPANSSSAGTAHSASQDEEAQRAARHEARTRAAVQSTWGRTTFVLCVLVVLAAALGSLFLKTAEQKSHLLSLLGSDRFTPASSNLSEAALLSPENETIFGEPRLDNPVFD
ncbi:hypothetical protein MTO96_010556 [Rhipicephalus appendiculatus]